MVDFLQQIIQFLNIDCAVVNCYYANPFEGLFYLVFLPSLLIILFIWFLTDTVLSKILKDIHRGLWMLFAVAFYIYIILQNFYTFFISLGQAWIILVIIVGILWFFFSFLKRGGAGRAAMPGLGGGGFLGGVAKEVKGRARLPSPQELKKARGYKESIESKFKKLESSMAAERGESNPEARAELRKTVDKNDRETDEAIATLGNLLTEVPALKNMYDEKPYYDRLKRLREKM